MNRGGVGSASIVLIFAVLCLTIFTMISYASAMADEVLIRREVDLVKNFYAADVLAEQVLHEILISEGTPDNVLGIEIDSYWDMMLWAERVSFIVPISETNELYVVVVIGEHSYEILTWRMQLIGEWEPFFEWNLWQGFDEEDGGLNLFDPDAFSW